MTLWLLFFLIAHVTADEVRSLPGLNFNLNFKHCSGYLDASPTRKLHYWFVESQNDPSTDPLIFWFNGGPGCSSLIGLLQELGPFLVNFDGKTLSKNEYSWNNNASVVLIESPAGVGFSYSTDGNTTTNDNLTAIQNYEAIKQFYSNFPQFSHNDVFLTGESYAGVYIPTLAVRIIDGMKKFDIKLKGIAIGNGLVNSQLKSETELIYEYFHGVIDEDQWGRILSECCNGKMDGCDFGGCHLKFGIKTDYNSYDLHSKCSTNKPELGELLGSVMYYNTATKSKYSLQADGNSNRNCVPASSLEHYLNIPEVRDALHVPSTIKNWVMCHNSRRLNYTSSLNDDQTENIKKIVGNQIRVLFYYGDNDSVCNFVMGQKFSHQLGLEKLARKEAWYYDDQIIGGYKTEYNNLTFLTINGAGHMVPQTHPRQMQHILRRFIDAYLI